MSTTRKLTWGITTLLMINIIIVGCAIVTFYFRESYFWAIGITPLLFILFIVDFKAGFAYIKKYKPRGLTRTISYAAVLILGILAIYLTFSFFIDLVTAVLQRYT